MYVSYGGKTVATCLRKPSPTDCNDGQNNVQLAKRHVEKYDVLQQSIEGGGKWGVIFLWLGTSKLILLLIIISELSPTAAYKNTNFKVSSK